MGGVFLAKERSSGKAEDVDGMFGSQRDATVVVLRIVNDKLFCMGYLKDHFGNLVFCVFNLFLYLIIGDAYFHIYSAFVTLFTFQLS